MWRNQEVEIAKEWSCGLSTGVFFEVTLKENKSKKDRRALPDSRLKVVC